MSRHYIKAILNFTFFNYVSFMCEHVLPQVIDMHVVLSIVGSYVVVVFEDWIWLQLWYIQWQDLNQGIVWRTKTKPKLICYLLNIHITSYLQNIYVYVYITFFQMCYMSFMLLNVVVWNYIFYNDRQFKMYNVLGLCFAISMFLYHENFDINIKAHKDHNVFSGSR